MLPVCHMLASLPVSSSSSSLVSPPSPHLPTLSVVTRREDSVQSWQPRPGDCGDRCPLGDGGAEAGSPHTGTRPGTAAAAGTGAMLPLVMAKPSLPSGPAVCPTNTSLSSSSSTLTLTARTPVVVLVCMKYPGIMPSDGMECFMDHVFVSQVMQRTRSIQCPCWEKTKLRLTPPGLCLQGLVSGCPYRHSLPGSGNRCPISSMTLLHKKMLGVSK